MGMKNEYFYFVYAHRVSAFLFPLTTDILYGFEKIDKYLGASNAYI